MRNTKKLDALLVKKTMSMATRKGDEYNGFLFGQMNPARLTDAERRSCNVYLFGSMWDRMTMKDLEALP
jgi:glycogen synthase